MTRIPLRVHPRPCRTLVRRLASGPLARDSTVTMGVAASSSLEPTQM